MLDFPKIRLKITLEAGFLDPAREAGFAADDAGLAEALDAGFAEALDAGLASAAFAADFDAGLEAAFDAGLVALEAGFAWDDGSLFNPKITKKDRTCLLGRGLFSSLLRRLSTIRRGSFLVCLALAAPSRLGFLLSSSGRVFPLSSRRCLLCGGGSLLLLRSRFSRSLFHGFGLGEVLDTAGSPGLNDLTISIRSSSSFTGHFRDFSWGFEDLKGGVFEVCWAGRKRWWQSRKKMQQDAFSPSNSQHRLLGSVFSPRAPCRGTWLMVASLAAEKYGGPTTPRDRQSETAFVTFKNFAVREYEICRSACTTFHCDVP